MKRILFLLALFIAATVLRAQQPGFTNPPGIKTADEGTDTSGRTLRLDCTGTGVTCTKVGPTTTLNVTGGGGSANTVEVSINFDTLNTLHTSSSSGDILNNWRPWPQPSLRNWNSVIWVSELNRFVTVGDSTGLSDFAAEVSYDGRQWSIIPTPVGSAAEIWRGLAWSPSLARLVAVGDPGTNRVMTSDNGGLTWTLRTASDVTVSWEGVAWSPSLNLFAAVATTASRAMSSPDGITWTNRTSASGLIWLDVEWSPSLAIFASVAASAGVASAMTSSDGITWTGQTTPSAIWRGLVWADDLGLFVAVGTDAAMTSPNGTAWTSRTIPTGVWRDVVWSSEIDMLVAIGGSGLIATSPDGITWTLRRSIAVDTYFSAAWSPRYGIFSVVGSNTTFLESSSILPEQGVSYTVTVTGQSWVTSSSEIICSPFATSADGQTIEIGSGAGFTLTTSNRVVSIGFDLTVFNPRGAVGTHRFHCTGA